MHQGKSDDDILIFFQKVGFDMSCELSPVGTVCMDCQTFFFFFFVFSFLWGWGMGKIFNP